LLYEVADYLQLQSILKNSKLSFIFDSSFSVLSSLHYYCHSHITETISFHGCKGDIKMDHQAVGCGGMAGSSWLRIGTGGGHLRRQE